ncbi:hypothetical protein CQ010_11990 [Arthrobacter sp. MYb211]|uniref:HAD family hydrolase n=1 Tax=unclassified Arthrobacter TaxID=235627 RepID=UPI000CFB8599|nr:MULTISPECIES: HAD-IA family hydrolase [unclassified Arthrobacter]PRA14094.1 hypothetical protein CQ015_02155 [Arthrobacter sp. MYb221]PRC06548.1 hypothetical protein CQ010_11990 [Arthrobacter sp. MYb211]
MPRNDELRIWVEEYASCQRTKPEAADLSGFSVVNGAGTAGVPKPNPPLFLAGCSESATLPPRTLYVGDNPVRDVRGAKNVGLIAALVVRTLEREPHSGATMAGLAELTALLRKTA